MNNISSQSEVPLSDPPVALLDGGDNALDVSKPLLTTRALLVVALSTALDTISFFLDIPIGPARLSSDLSHGRSRPGNHRKIFRATSSVNRPSGMGYDAQWLISRTGVDEDASQLAWMMRAWYRVKVTMVSWTLFSSSMHMTSHELNEPYLDRAWLVVQFPTCKLWIFAQDKMSTLPN